jgi:osmotically-inducible protein OsmY
MKSKLVTACFVCGSLLAPVGVYAQTQDAPKERSAPREAISDAMITAKVKAELARDKEVLARNINVDTDKSGVVQLSGTARTKEEADKAVQIAKSVKGVVSVQNNIQVASSAR